VNKKTSKHRLPHILLSIVKYLAILVVSFGILVTLLIVIYYWEWNQTRLGQIKETTAILKSQNAIINQVIKTTYYDSIFLAEYLKIGDPVEDQEAFFKTFLQSHPTYQEVSVTNGLTKKVFGAVRLGTQILRSTEQNKSFDDILKFHASEEFVFTWQLNSKNGVAQYPFTPVIKLVTPLDGRYEDSYLVVSRNPVIIQEIIKFFDSNPDSYGSSVFDPTGHLIYFQQENFHDRFADMILQNKNIINIYPLVWKYMQENLEGQIRIEGQGMLLFSRISMPAVEKNARQFSDESGKFVVARYLPEDQTRFMPVTHFRPIFPHIAFGTFLLLILIMQIYNTQKGLKEKLDFMIYRDSLTKAKNRTAFDELILREEKKRIINSGLVYIDLDDLKETNDLYGHVMGDILIVKSVELMELAVGDLGDVYRIGGDEFVIYMPESDPDELSGVVKKIKALLNDEKINTVPHVTLSIGYEFCSDPHLLRAKLLQADNMMYANKRDRIENK